MTEPMTLERLRDWHRKVQREWSSADLEERMRLVIQFPHGAAATFLDAHLAQQAQAVDVGAEDRFEQYVKTLIDSAPDVKKLGERLTHLLDDDQFNNIEPTLLGIARAIGNAQADGWKVPAGCLVIQESDCVPHVHREYGPGLFFTEDAVLDLATPPKAEE